MTTFPPCLGVTHRSKSRGRSHATNGFKTSYEPASRSRLLPMFRAGETKRARSPWQHNIVCGAISSRLGDHESYAASLPNNPHIQFIDARRHGYTRCTLTSERALFEFRAVDDVRDPRSDLATLAAFETERGLPRLRQV